MSIASSSTLVFPGQPLLPSTPGATSIGGTGTFTRGGQIFSSTVGRVSRDGGTVSVHRPPTASAPKLSSSITGLITRLTRPQAHVQILTVDGSPLPPGQDFQGVIRTQDVRSVEVDKVRIWGCFRPGMW